MSQTKAPAKPSFADFCIQSKANDDYFLEIIPQNKHWIAFLANQEGGQQLAQKIHDNLSAQEIELKEKSEGETQYKWGLSISKRGGISAIERISIDGKSDSKNNATLRYRELILTIIKEQEFQIQEQNAETEQESKIEKAFTPEQINEIVIKAMDDIVSLNAKQLSLVTPHLKQINEINDELYSLSETIGQVTHLVRTRLISDWTEEDTGKLHSAMFAELLSIFRSEERYRTSPVAENPTPA